MIYSPPRNDGLWMRRLGGHVGDKLIDKALRLRAGGYHGFLRGDHDRDSQFELGVREREPESVDDLFRRDARGEVGLHGERARLTGHLGGLYAEAVVEDDGATAEIARRAVQVDRELEECRCYGKIDRFGHVVLSRDETASGTDGRKAPRIRFKTFIVFDIGLLQRN